MSSRQSISSSPAISVVVKVGLCYISTLAVIMFTSRLIKGFSKRSGELWTVLIASILTLILVYVFTRWSKLRLRDVGLAEGRVAINRFAGGFVIGLIIAVGQALIVRATGHLKLIPVSEGNEGSKPVVQRLQGERSEREFFAAGNRT